MDKINNQKSKHIYLTWFVILVIITVAAIIYSTVLHRAGTTAELTEQKSAADLDKPGNAFLLAYFRSGINQTDMKMKEI